jgi:hypothetical protein
MITKAQAIDAQYFHENGTTNSSGGCQIWRRNGKTKVWKTRPSEFRIPIKWGLYRYGYIFEATAHEFHVEDDCPKKES